MGGSGTVGGREKVARVDLCQAEITLTPTVFLFAGCALIDGTMSNAGAVSHERWGALLVEGCGCPGLCNCRMALVTAARDHPGVRLRKLIAGKWVLALAAVASLSGALVLALWFGVYTLVFGVLLIALGFRLRRWGRGTVGSRSIGRMRTTGSATNYESRVPTNRQVGHTFRGHLNVLLSYGNWPLDLRLLYGSTEVTMKKYAIRLLPLMAGAVCLLLAAEVRTDYNHAADFGQFRTCPKLSKLVQFK